MRGRVPSTTKLLNRAPLQEDNVLHQAVLVLRLHHHTKPLGTHLAPSSGRYQTVADLVRTRHLLLLHSSSPAVLRAVLCFYPENETVKSNNNKMKHGAGTLLMRCLDIGNHIGNYIGDVGPELVRNSPKRSKNAFWARPQNICVIHQKT